jgi:hypothetical protein
MFNNFVMAVMVKMMMSKRDRTSSQSQLLTASNAMGRIKKFNPVDSKSSPV